MIDVKRLAEKIYGISITQPKVSVLPQIESLLREAMEKLEDEYVDLLDGNEKISYEWGKRDAYTFATEAARNVKTCGAVFPNCDECDCGEEIATAIEKLKDK